MERGRRANEAELAFGSVKDEGPTVVPPTLVDDGRELAGEAPAERVCAIG